MFCFVVLLRFSQTCAPAKSLLSLVDTLRSFSCKESGKVG